MKLFRRRRREEDVDDPPFSSGDVRIVPRDPSTSTSAGIDGASTETSSGARSSAAPTAGATVLDELSQAFSDGDDIDDSGATAVPPWATDDDSADIAGGDDTGSGDESDTDAIDVDDVTDPTETDPTETDDGPRIDTDDSGSTPTMSERATIAIGGDDLPDAIYLDDGLDDDSGTVFIDDDDRGDAVHTHEAAGPGIEPRIRQRRIGVRRAEARGRLKWVVLGLVVVIVAVGALAVLGSGLFAIDRVDVTGQRYADQAAVDAIVDDLVGTPVLLADTADAERRLEEIPWIADARVSTDFPNGALVEIRERTPRATVRGPDGRYRVLDREGRVLQVEDGQPLAPVLIATPLPADLASGDFADVGFAAGASLVTKLTPEVRSRLDSIEVAADGSDMVLRLRDESESGGVPGDGTASIEVRLGVAIGDNEQFEKLVRLERVLDDLAASDATIVDVSTEETTLR